MTWAKGGREFFARKLGSAWDTARWAGKEVPGLVRVTVSTERKIDVSNGPGIEGAQLRPQGSSPAEVGVEIVIWTDEQDTALQALLKVVDPRVSGRKLVPYILEHPAMQRASVAGIVVEKTDWYGEGPVAGTRMVKCACKQWLKPRRAVIGTPVITGPTTAAVEPVSLPPSKGGKANF